MPHPYSQSHSHTHSLKLKGGAANPVSGMLNSLTKGALGTTGASAPAAAKPVATAAAAKPTVATATAAKPASTTATAVKKGGKKDGKKYKGGDASNWVGSNFGSTVTQHLNNTFGNGGPGNAGNLIPTVHGAKAVGPHNIPQGSNMAYIKSGGQRHRHTKSCGCRSKSGGQRHRHTKSCGCGSKRGGNYGQVLSAAAVPFGLMGANYLLSRRRQGKSAKARTVRRRSRRRYA